MMLFMWLAFVWSMKFLRVLFTMPDLESQVDMSISLLFVIACPVILLANHLPLIRQVIGRAGGLMTYSKFAHDAKCSVNLPARTGMLIAYAPSAVYGLGAAVVGTSGDVGRGRFVALMVATHFIKRCYECVNVHRYSGTMPLFTSFFLSTVYAIISCCSCYYAAQTEEQKLSTKMLCLGTIMFVVGLAGNYYHHVLLASLRKDGEKEYKLPFGGLFYKVSAPHYLFELLGWYGLAFVAQHFIVMLICYGMTFYLGERAAAQTYWNKANINGYPGYPYRRHLIPYIF